MEPGADTWRAWFARHRYLPVFASLLFVLSAISIIQTTPHIPVFLVLVLAGIAYGPLRLASRATWAQVAFLLLLALRVAGLWLQTPDALVIADAAVLAVFVLGSGAILVDVLRQPSVGLDAILGGCSVYLVVGLCFALGYSLLETLSPGSFTIGGRPLDGEYMHRVPQLVYLSYIILTSVGFGDILPISRAARGLAMFEAIFGQLYLAILIARLVSLHSSRNQGH